VVGVLGGAALARGVSPLSARSPDRLPPNVHAEYIKYASGTDSITAYLAYREPAAPAPAVLVIHEIFGMSDFVRDAAQRLAKDGFVALAPDLLSRRGGTPASPDDARKLIASLNPDTVTRDLDAAATYVRGLKVVDSTKFGVIGFGWGGGESLRYAAHNQSLGAFVVCYGAAPNVPFDFARIKARGFGVYADRDGRITQGIYNLERDFQKANVDYRFKIYPNTAHGFLRTGQPAQAVVGAWQDILSVLAAWLYK
jgi:carboxymethylenebutenolidase